jgi:Cu/Ag efflux protein CusF
VKRASFLLVFAAFLGAFPAIFPGWSVVPASAEELKADTNVIIPMDSTAPTQGYPGTGTVNSLDIKVGRISLSSEPIASLGWAAQSRDFQVLDRDSLADLKPGQKVTFELVKLFNGNYVAIKVAPAK